MATESLFAVGVGVELQNELGVTLKQTFAVHGVPSSAGLPAEQLALCDNAPVGSEATDYLSGFVYTKKEIGAGETKWSRQATLLDIVSSPGNDSWREPAKVKDDTAYASLSAAETAVNIGTVDGVAIVPDDRILFTGITGSNKNVFIVTGTLPTATLVEDTNAPTTNDVLIVNDGTSAGIEYHYSEVTSTWVESSTSASNEDGFQNAYTGKPGIGAQSTTYTSQTAVTNGDSLTTAVGKLDAQVGTNAGAITALNISQGAIQTETDAIESALGASVDANGDYVALVGSNYLDANTDFTADLVSLDAQIKVNEDALANLGGKTETLGVTAVTAVDSALVDDVVLINWLVHVQQGNIVNTFEVSATHDGTAGTDATTADFTKYAKLKLNGLIGGLIVSVDVNGSGIAQELRLLVTSAVGVDVKTSRTQVI